MNKEELIEKLKELKNHIWVETGNGNMLYGKREKIDDMIHDIICEVDESEGPSEFGDYDVNFIED